MEFMKLLAAPLIGAVIGYCTNYIAVKMLFRPLKPVKVFGKTLPFTPGIIPKRKPVLARAIAQMVGKSLVGEQEITDALTSDRMKDAVVTSITAGLERVVAEHTVREDGVMLLGEAQYEEKKTQAVNAVTDKLVDNIAAIDFAEIIVREGTAAIRGVGGMIAMFVNENTVRGFAEPIAEKAQSYVRAEGRDYILQKVGQEVDQAEGKTLAELLSIETMEGMKAKIASMYDEVVAKETKNIAAAFDVCGIVETKINEMEVLELEQLIMSVMKNELGMIVNLGALIGFVLGLCNLLF